MRADRLISIIMLLQNRGKMATKKLAKELEVSERTIHRDMEALSAAGIPVVAERGKEGGWRLLENYRSKLDGLKSDEIKSLFISPSEQLLADLGLKVHSVGARQKLLADIPTIFRQEAKNMWERIYIDTSTWRQSTEKIHSFQTIQQAVWDDQKLVMNYERADGQTDERIVEPLGLVAQGNKWYLVASRDGEIRNYRASRIHSAKLLNETFNRPVHFNLAEYWKQSKQEFIEKLPQYQVDVEISPTILQRIKFTGRFVQVLKTQVPLENGWVPATLCFDTEKEAKEYILGFGDQIKIVSPKELQEKIISMAKAVIHFYNSES